jgi:hypothetical protein
MRVFFKSFQYKKKEREREKGIIECNIRIQCCHSLKCVEIAGLKYELKHGPLGLEVSKLND